MKRAIKLTKKMIEGINGYTLRICSLFPNKEKYREFMEHETALKLAFPHFTRFQRMVAFEVYDIDKQSGVKRKGVRMLTKLFKCSEREIREFFDALYDEQNVNRVKKERTHDPLTLKERKLVKEYKQSLDKEITPDQLEALQTNNSCVESSSDVNYEDKDELLDYAVRVKKNSLLS